MSEDANTIILAGRVVGFIHPEQGQIESIIRIGRTLRTGTDDAPNEFWVKQVERLGLLLESLIVPADRELVDELYLTGKISHKDLIGAIFGKISENAEKSENQAIAKAKAKTRAERK